MRTSSMQGRMPGILGSAALAVVLAVVLAAGTAGMSAQPAAASVSSPAVPAAGLSQ
jgi:hypothetical protein